MTIRIAIPITQQQKQGIAKNNQNNSSNESEFPLVRGGIFKYLELDSCTGKYT